MYIMDTNVVSELRKGAKADKQVISWARSVPTSSLFISVITLLELEIGVLLKERKDSSQGALLRAWLTTHVLPAFSDRIINIDVAVVQRCAKLHVPDKQSERDALIAATALVHGMTLVTRNVKDFIQTDVELYNPWE